jgi:hypothetical protein
VLDLFEIPDQQKLGRLKYLTSEKLERLEYMTSKKLGRLKYLSFWEISNQNLNFVEERILIKRLNVKSYWREDLILQMSSIYFQRFWKIP